MQKESWFYIADVLLPGSTPKTAKFYLSESKQVNVFRVLATKKNAQTISPYIPHFKYQGGFSGPSKLK